MNPVLMPAMLLQSQFVEDFLKLGLTYTQSQAIACEMLHRVMISDVAQPAIKLAYKQLGDKPEAPQN